MSQPPQTYKRAQSRKSKTPPVKRITLSAEARAEYEKLVQERDARDRDYGRHLSSDNKPR